MNKKLVASIKDDFGTEIINIGFDVTMTLEPDEPKNEDDPSYLTPCIPHYENTIKWVELVIGGVGNLQPESYWKQKKVMEVLEAEIENQVDELFNK